ncbi:hypothetical protein BHE74_00039620, partial [Ensete ventricosum]
MVKPSQSHRHKGRTRYAAHDVGVSTSLSETAALDIGTGGRGTGMMAGFSFSLGERLRLMDGDGTNDQDKKRLVGGGRAFQGGRRREGTPFQGILVEGGI